MKLKAKKLPDARTVLDHFRRPISLVVALVVLVIGYFVVLAAPVRIYQQNYSLLQKLNSDISVAKTDLETAKKYSDKLLQLSPLEIKLLDMALPARSDDSSLLAQLAPLAQRAGFSVSNIDIEPGNGLAGKVASDKVGKTSIRLKLQGGGYEELKQLVRLLESSLLMIDINSVSFTEKSPIYDLALTTYYFSNPAAK